MGDRLGTLGAVVTFAFLLFSLYFVHFQLSGVIRKGSSQYKGWDGGNLLQKISAIPTFILGAPFSYYPRELKMDKVRGKEQK